MAKTSKAAKPQEVENTTEENAAEENINTVSDEIIELQWEEVESVFNMRAEMAQMEQYLANMFIQFEKTKSDILARLQNGEEFMYMAADNLRTTKNINENLTYELKLPNSANEKGYFVRKERTE